MEDWTRRHNLFFGILGLVLVMSVFAQPAGADGKFFSLRTETRPPTIPSQKTLLIYRDGTERLVIESAVDAEGQELGWVVPVPARPTELEEESAGLIDTLSRVLQPKVVYRRVAEMRAWILPAIAVCLWALVVIAFRPYWIVSMGLLGFLGVITVYLPVSCFMYDTNKMNDRAGVLGSGVAQTGVRVEETARVGSYDAAVLEARDAAALDQWLEKNGLSGLSENDTGIVSDYITEGWYFVAMKLRREGNGLSKPHPIGIEFPVEKPVYPVRLTGTSGSKVYLELFMVADGTASCPGLKRDYSDSFSFKHSSEARKRFWIGENGLENDGISGWVVKAKTWYDFVEHPAASRMFWDGCVITKLVGTLQPAQMRESDLWIHFEPPEPHKRSYYTSRAARDIGWLVTLIGWTVAVPVGFFCLYGKLREPRGRLLVGVPVILCGATLALIAGQIPYHYLPRARVEMQHRPREYELAEIRGSVARYLHRRAEEGKLNSKDLQASCEKFFAGKASDGAIYSSPDIKRDSDGRVLCPLTGEPMEMGDSPGDYEIIEDERGVLLRMYGPNGEPWEMNVTK